MKYLEEAKQIWKEHVPKQGQAGTVQGELLRAIEKLRDEAQRNGNINWDKGHQILSSFLLKTLGDSTVFSESDLEEIKSDIVRIQDYKNPYTEDDLYDRISDRIIEWCKDHPEPVPHAKNPDLLR